MSIQPHIGLSRTHLVHNPWSAAHCRGRRGIKAMGADSNIGAAHRILFLAAEEGRDLCEPWAQFAAAAKSIADRPPLHLAAIFQFVCQLKTEVPEREISILDHGCGGAVTLLLLLATGFKGIFGIDMPLARSTVLNRVTKEIFSIPEQRFFCYDGQRLPFDDASFDFVFSQQVIEHVRDADLAAYYAEEGRVLRRGGLAYHQVPHRWVPYDTHSRTWLLHWLPRRLQMAGYSALGRNAAYLDSMLFLRTPRTHFSLARKHIGPLKDLTAARLGSLPDTVRYDGPIQIRRLMHRAVETPVIGRGVAAVLKNLVMLETVAEKI